MYFVDTSALVKTYIRERGTGAVHHAMRELGGSSLYISRLGVAEAMCVFTRKLREKSIRYAAYVQARDDLASHVKTRLSLVRINEDVLVDAASLVDRERTRGPGTLDMVHLATAEYLQAVYPHHTVGFMCSDDKLGRLATVRGFDVFDPETTPVHELLPPDLGLPE